MKVETCNFKFVTSIEGIGNSILKHVSNISIKNAEITYGLEYEEHVIRHYKKLKYICDGMSYWENAVEPAYADVKTGFLIQVSHEGKDDTWSKAIITIFPIEEGDVKREKPIARFEQTGGFVNIFHTREDIPISPWVNHTIRGPVVRYIVGEIDFNRIVEDQYVYFDIQWDSMVTLFSMITEEQRKKLINEHNDRDNKWHVTDVIFQIELLANAEVMNNLHDYDEFKQQFKREDILTAISNCNQNGNYELQIFLNHCVSQETEEDRRKRWEL